ncbi:transporter substrate-binding domain-containing protein [Dechloromonas agitata]|mgnify:FL=1|uniref:Transporter substrate-binding domain-containing protein n=1 Tax=Dechloromonas agitata TaxID=73030 RepID=A0A930BVZ4_9RHOO|nr:transporter substrate-binding domain-containing protein [Dechloromonas agitata]MBF1164770.1 transporter substrate-binding domain-containing protein [Dechloromonas agitata]MDE1545180.1 transporter substrate-binding domain-containing protein [Dechloromonas agitata]
MKNDRRLWLKALVSLPLATALPASANALETIHQRGRLRVAVYNDFPPYSLAGGKGIDADIARAIAAKLGVTAEIVGYNADEDMNDDLRNMVWKGHYLGAQPSDVMMHVPVDEYLAKANDKVRIFGPYHRESIALARLPERVPKAPTGSAAVALEVFTREKIGVETASLADSFLLSVLNGRLRENVVHFKTVSEATKAMNDGKVAAVMAQRAELEAALQGDTRAVIETPQLPELKVDGWPLGMAVKAEEMELANALAAALGELKKDGTIAAIFKRYGISHQPA